MCEGVVTVWDKCFVIICGVGQAVRATPQRHIGEVDDCQLCDPNLPTGPTALPSLGRTQSGPKNPAWLWWDLNPWPSNPHFKTLTTTLHGLVASRSFLKSFSRELFDQPGCSIPSGFTKRNSHAHKSSSSLFFFFFEALNIHADWGILATIIAQYIDSEVHFICLYGNQTRR